MNEKEMLNEILENTKTVKNVVVEKFEKKPPKEKTAKQKAEAKFKMVGTKLNPKELEEFEAKLAALDLNASQYFKKASKFDFEANEELLRQQDKSIEEYKKQLHKEKEIVRMLNSDISNFKGEISTLKAKLDKELNKTLWEKIRALF